MSLYLGLDLSTQSLTGVAIDPDRRTIEWQGAVSFDADLPAHGTRAGVLANDDPRIVHSPPAMWVDALQILMERLAPAVDVSRIRAVAASGQQHGSVYLSARAPTALASLDPAQGLRAALGDVFTRATSPIWQDSSTSVECDEIRRALGGAEGAARATGSDVFERFTGPQIRRFYRTEPAAWERTAHVALVSSFVTSLLAGRLAPIDHADGAGMNLMDVATRDWHAGALRATAPDLARRLGPLAPSTIAIGPIAPWFSKRCGFAPDTLVLAGTGDNPSSLVGVGLVEPGQAAISLGTSDTFFACLDAPSIDPTGQGHLFGSPTGDWMALLCVRNGSLARERVRDQFGLDWRGFSEAIASTPPGNAGKVLLPWFEPEIAPRLAHPRVERHGGLSPADAAGHCRAVVEAQLTSIRLHSAWIGDRPRAIRTTGGASANPAILRILADVFDCPVQRFRSTHGAALGAALRAHHGHLLARGEKPRWSEVVAGFTDPEPGSTIQPDPKNRAAYDDLADRFRTLLRARPGA